MGNFFKNISRRINQLFFAALLFTATPFIVKAGGGGTGSSGSSASGSIKGPITGDLITFINRITVYIRPIIAVIFVIVIIYGGIVRMTALGNPEKEKQSNLILTSGIIGFLIVVLAPAIVNFVSSIVGLKSGFI